MCYEGDNGKKSVEEDVCWLCFAVASNKCNEKDERDDMNGFGGALFLICVFEEGSGQGCNYTELKGRVN